MKRIRQVGRRGIVWMALVIGSIVVAGTMAASSPPRPSEPGSGEADVFDSTGRSLVTTAG